ncbi:MAG: hypothetical protein QW514_10295 [Thermoprotei archaeon]
MKMKSYYFLVVALFISVLCDSRYVFGQSATSSIAGVFSKVGISVLDVSGSRLVFRPVVDMMGNIKGNNVTVSGSYGVAGVSQVFLCNTDVLSIKSWAGYRESFDGSSNFSGCNVPAVGLAAFSENTNSINRLSTIQGSGVTISPSRVLAVGDVIIGSDGFSRANKAAFEDNASSNDIPRSGNMGFDGSTWDRLISVSNTNNTATTTQGVRYYAPISTWSITNTPATGTQATATKAAGGSTVRHVATSVTACVAANATAQTPILIHLRDGASGSGTILRTWAISAPATSSQCIDISGLNMTGSANTAMTIETASAPVTGAQATVTLTGYSTP